MTALVGNFSLSLAVLVALGAVLAAVAAGRFDSSSILRAARWLLVALFAVLSLSSAALLVALVQSDFQFDYVVRYTERALPLGYKLAAFWAGQEGSLLLWAWMLAGMCAIAVFNRKPGPSGQGSIAHEKAPALKSRTLLEASMVVAALSVVCGFFAALILFAANPFKVLNLAPADGRGLNPMLQDPGMIWHPPLLFLGYAGFTIPFALLLGALVAGRKDNEWLLATRRWTLFSWLALSIGILLGAQWAYVELGWGGYWAWDPVENASLLPWLTGTALLHSIMVQQHRGMFKKWNAVLISATFILCIFGTYLTRSGVIQSVHSFGESLIGTFFLVFLGVLVVLSLGIIIARRRLLKPEYELDGLMGKEGFFLATNVLLVGMTVITLIGTIFPIISNVLGGQQITPKPSFYNTVVAPMGLGLVALMAVGPLLIYGKDASTKLIHGSIVPLIVAVATVATFVVMGLKNVWALIAAAIVACALASILIDLVRTTAARVRSHGENPITALIRLLDANHRRYGGQVVHVGMLMIVVGITASSLFEKNQTFAMKVGESVQFEGRTLTLTALKPAREVNFEALQATLTVTDASGVTDNATPQIRKYDKWEQLNSEVSIRSNWREDVYVTLAAYDGQGGVTIQAIINPLVSWIWAGGIVLTIGAVVGLLPRVLPHAEGRAVEKSTGLRGAGARVAVHVPA
jgi:cytochrome c-type biogenesis protein CcmF